MTNPYESPAIGQTELLPHSRVWRRVWWPAVVLVAMCVVQLLGIVLLFIGIGMFQAAPEPRRMSYLQWFFRALGTNFLWQLGIFMSASVVVLIGAWQALRLRSLAMARLSAFWACVPFLTPLLVAGIPFGVWLLIVLFQRETTAEFERLSAARKAKTI